MKEYRTIKVTQKETSLFITLNRPEVHNALSHEMVSELTQILKDIEKESTVRHVFLKGEGKNLCAGADIREMHQSALNTFEENKENAKKLADLFHLIYHIRFPVIVHAKGMIFGGGVGLVAASDIVIAETETVFCLSEVKLGIIPAVISPYIIQAMGQRQAKRYSLTAECFSAKEAYGMGLVHQVGRSEEIPFLLDTLKTSLRLGSPTAQQHVKCLFNEISQGDFSQKRGEMTAHAIAQARASEDGKEGLQAFLDKRKPTWV
jgi:methylglutaconyl-CoA hydratase